LSHLGLCHQGWTHQSLPTTYALIPKRNRFSQCLCVWTPHTVQTTSQGNTVFHQHLGSHFRAKHICYLERNTAACILGNLILRENGLQFSVHSFQTIVSGPEFPLNNPPHFVAYNCKRKLLSSVMPQWNTPYFKNWIFFHIGT
jgi:hypothetical protein